MRVSVQETPRLIRARQPFTTGGAMRAELDGNTYTVYSYAMPILKLDLSTGNGFVDYTKVSPTTSTHQNCVLVGMWFHDVKERQKHTIKNGRVVRPTPTLASYGLECMWRGRYRVINEKAFKRACEVGRSVRLQGLKEEDTDVPLTPDCVYRCGYGTFYVSLKGNTRGVPASDSNRGGLSLYGFIMEEDEEMEKFEKSIEVHATPEECGLEVIHNDGEELHNCYVVRDFCKFKEAYDKGYVLDTGEKSWEKEVKLSAKTIYPIDTASFFVSNEEGKGISLAECNAVKERGVLPIERLFGVWDDTPKAIATCMPEGYTREV